MKFHMLFEQSGTFKNVFKSYGHEAYDYDILNDYGQTDFKIDLFKEIEMAYSHLTCKYIYNSMDYSNCNCGFCWRNNLKEQQTTVSIFDKMKPETDFIMAFFPCTYFSDLNENQFRMYYGQPVPIINRSSVERTLRRNAERAHFFNIWIKFCFICQEKKLRTVIENPVGNNNRNFLKLYSAWQPKFTDMDRTKFGDIFKKPTHYFAINFDMKENFQMYDKEYFNTKTVINSGCSRRERSETTPRYADNFYKRFIENQI